MIQLAVPERLYQFRQGRLPLGCPIRYRGERGQVVGRTFSTEDYDVRNASGVIARNIPLGELEVDFPLLGGGA